MKFFVESGASKTYIDVRLLDEEQRKFIKGSSFVVFLANGKGKYRCKAGKKTSKKSKKISRPKKNKATNSVKETINNQRKPISKEKNREEDARLDGIVKTLNKDFQIENENQIRGYPERIRRKTG